MASKRILVVDDSSEVRQLIEDWIGAQPGPCEVVGFARDGYEAINQAAKLLPDVIIMDLNMPRMDGVRATDLITESFPEIEVIGLTGSGDPQKLLGAGAAAAFHKTDLSDALDRAGC